MKSSPKEGAGSKKQPFRPAAGIDGLCRGTPGKDHVGYIEHQVLFGAGHAVQAAQARVAVHQQDTAAPLGQRAAQSHRQGGLAHAAFPRRDYCCYTHRNSTSAIILAHLRQIVKNKCAQFTILCAIDIFQAFSLAKNSGRFLSVIPPAFSRWSNRARRGRWQSFPRPHRPRRRRWSCCLRRFPGRCQGWEKGWRSPR